MGHKIVLEAKRLFNDMDGENDEQQWLAMQALATAHYDRMSKQGQTGLASVIESAHQHMLARWALAAHEKSKTQVGSGG